MGASGWSYYVPYQPDFGAALAQLRQQVFARNAYYSRSKHKLKSIDDLIKLNGEDGTHSIIDITRVAPPPTQPGGDRQPLSRAAKQASPDPEAQQRWVAEWRDRFATASELHPDDLVELIGTTKPTRAQVETAALDIMTLRKRWVATIVVIYDGAQPRELAFLGTSGD